MSAETQFAFNQFVIIAVVALITFFIVKTILRFKKK